MNKYSLYIVANICPNSYEDKKEKPRREGARKRIRQQ